MSEHQEEAHTGPIKTPRQLLLAVFYSFVVPVFIIIGLVYYVTSGNQPAAGSSNAPEAVAARIQKVGVVEIKDANGNVVDTIDLGELDAGNHVFTWDGKSSSDATMTAGNYTFNVVATNNGKEVKATELNFGRVDAVLRDGGQRAPEFGFIQPVGAQQQILGNGQALEGGFAGNHESIVEIAASPDLSRAAHKKERNVAHQAEQHSAPFT